jgi:hypothetical protein
MPEINLGIRHSKALHDWGKTAQMGCLRSLLKGKESTRQATLGKSIRAFQAEGTAGTKA